MLPHKGLEYQKHRFSCETIGMFIRPSVAHPEDIGIVLVNDKLLYVSYDELEEVAV